MVTGFGGTLAHKYFHTNHQGSVIAMSDDTGSKAEGPYTYDPYGNCFSGANACSGGEPYRFTGRRFDPETELYYYRARYYWANGGRFLQTDPVGYTADLNLYTYVGNDPANKTDPTGNDTWGSGCSRWQKGCGGIGDIEGNDAATYEPRSAAIVIGTSEDIGTGSPIAQPSGVQLAQSEGADPVESSGPEPVFQSETAEALERSEQGEEGRAAAAAAGQDVPKEITPEEIQQIFSISDWSGYPGNLPKPEGPFRILEGDEYEKARDTANRTNRQMHRSDPSLRGRQIHEIKPVKFGGNPVARSNKMPLSPEQHAPATSWWNQLLRDLTGSMR